MKKRILSLLLAVLMVVGMIPTSVFAEEESITVETTGSVCEVCGNEVCTCCTNELCTCEPCTCDDCACDGTIWDTVGEATDICLIGYLDKSGENVTFFGDDMTTTQVASAECPDYLILNVIYPHENNGEAVFYMADSFDETFYENVLSVTPYIEADMFSAVVSASGLYATVAGEGEVTLYGELGVETSVVTVDAAEIAGEYAVADFSYDPVDPANWYFQLTPDSDWPESAQDALWINSSYITNLSRTATQQPGESCPTCGQVGCTSGHENWCEICQKDDCSENHEAEVPSISATVTDSNGNVQTVTVSGDCLPEGATLVVTPVENEAAVMVELEMSGGFIWDIKVFDADGNEWQPADGEIIKLSISMPHIENGSVLDIFHFLETTEQVNAAIDLGNAEIGSIAGYSEAVTAIFRPAVVAYSEATSTDDGKLAATIYENVEVIDGKITVATTGFSIYTWNGSYSHTRYENGSGERLVLKSNSGGTWFVTKGQTVYLDSGENAGDEDNWTFSGPITVSGWQTNDRPYVTVNSNATLGATCTMNVKWGGVLGIGKYDHTVYFVVVDERTVNFYNGSTLHATDTVVTDGGSRKESVAWPSNPSQTNRNFLGWSTTNGGTSIINTSSWYPTAATTNLYAVYNYNVSYNLQGGSGTSSTQTNFSTVNTTLHGTPTRSGYTFLGWYSSTDNTIYGASSTYTLKQNTTMTALWGKQETNGSWNNSFYVLPGTSGFCATLKNIDGSTVTTATDDTITRDSNIYYVAPSSVLTFACSGGKWRIDSSESGLELTADSATVGNGAWVAADTATLTVSASAVVGTTMMIYTQTGTSVHCAKIVVQTSEQITQWTINDPYNNINIYRVGVYVLYDSTKTPGEPKYTTGVSMFYVGGTGGMQFATSGAGIVDPAIADSAQYISSLDGSCTMGVVSYTGQTTLPYLDDSVSDRAMERLIEILAAGGKVIAADGSEEGIDLLAYYQAYGADAVRENFEVRPHIIKLMTGLSYLELGWHIDCSVYALTTRTVTYNLNPPTGYVLKSLGTPDPEIEKTSDDTATATVTSDIAVGNSYTATVTGATDTATLTFVCWNTKPDGTGTSYAPGTELELDEDITLYAIWSGGSFDTGTLEVYKEVTVADNSDAPNAGDSFTFTINLTGSYAYTVYTTGSGAKVSSGTMTNGTFTLQAGQFIRITGVKVADYVITESNLPGHYTAAQASQSVSLVGGYVNKVTFSNQYKNIPNFAVTGTIANGTVTNGGQTIPRGANSAAMVFTPAVGYEISSITVDGSAITVTDAMKSGYTYPAQSNVSKNHSVVVTTAPITYTATFLPNGGTVSPTSRTFTITGALSLPTPTRTGYTFAGWKVTTVTGNWTNGKTYAATATAADAGRYGNVTLTAQWTAASYAVSFNVNYTGGTNPDNKSVTYDSKYGALPTVSREGYTFDGWYTAASGGTEVTADTVCKTAEAHTLYAHWTAKDYTITFDYNGGHKKDNTSAITSSHTVTSGSSNYYEVIWLYPEKTGYDFAGWYTLPEGGVQVYGSNGYCLSGDYWNSSNQWIGTADLTVYAQWIPNTYYVSFNGNGATSGTMDNQTYIYDTAQELTANDFSLSYAVTYDANSGNCATTGTTATATFNGWSTSATGSKVYNNQHSVSNLTAIAGATVPLYANWTLGSVTLPNATRDGYTFNGWSDGTITYAAGASYTPTKNVTLIAQWTRTTYPVSYNANGGTGAIVDQSKVHGTDLTLSDGTGFTRTGYRLAGWNTQADGTGTAYALGGTYQTNAAVTLYAQWEKQYTVTVIFNETHLTPTNNCLDGYVKDTNGNYQITADAGDTVTMPTFSANNGYQLGVVKINGVSAGAGANNLVLDKDTVITVESSVINYTITCNLNEGSWPQGATVPATYNVETETFTLPPPTREGYNFKGWATVANAQSGEMTITIQKGTTGNKTYYATWERALVDLTISTSCADKNQSFIFTISGPVTLEVVLVGDDSITIKNLPVGEYTVVEKDGWSWRHNEVINTGKFVLDENATLNTFAFGSVNNIYWLSGCSDNVKRKKGGG